MATIPPAMCTKSHHRTLAHGEGCPPLFPSPGAEKGEDAGKSPWCTNLLRPNLERVSGGLADDRSSTHAREISIAGSQCSLRVALINQGPYLVVNAR